MEKWKACQYVKRETGSRAAIVDDGCIHMHRRRGKCYVEKKKCEDCEGIRVKDAVIFCRNSCVNNHEGKCVLKEIKVAKNGECLSRER